VKNVYSAEFYEWQSQGSARSAAAMVPYIVKLLEPAKVLDVGCGVGTWCCAFRDCGVDAYGVDGDWVANGFLLPREKLTAFDFGAARAPFQVPLPHPRFDLVTTFEFLEHIDAERAGPLVDFLTSCADVVIAGAAIPGQGGEHHVNEAWPSYWADLFAARGYQPFDFIRTAFWDRPDIEPWYLQNTIGYFRGGVPEAVRREAERIAVARLSHPTSLVHPQMFIEKVAPRTFRKRAREALSVLSHRIDGRPPNGTGMAS